MERMMGRHILLAGGRDTLRHSIALLLKQAGYRVSQAGTLSKALAIIQSLRGSPEAVNLLITDLDFPSGGSCRDLLERVFTGQLSLPYLLIAEEVEKHNEIALTAHGCLRCITRPFEPEFLLHSIRGALGRDLS